MAGWFHGWVEWFRVLPEDRDMAGWNGSECYPRTEVGECDEVSALMVEDRQRERQALV